MHWLWTTGRNSGNEKTGKIPTAYPADLDAADASCQGCVLRPGKHRIIRDPDKPQCYFWHGQGVFGIKLMHIAKARGRRYDFDYALAHRSKCARAVRMSGGGDPCTTDRRLYKRWRTAAKAAGLAWIDYTHFWRDRGAWLRGTALASCDTWDEAVAAVKAGWRAAVHVPRLDTLQGVVDGVRYTLCPAQRPVPINCNQCRLCDASTQAVDVIVFLNH